MQIGMSMLHMVVLGQDRYMNRPGYAAKWWSWYIAGMTRCMEASQEGWDAVGMQTVVPTLTGTGPVLWQVHSQATD